MFPTIFTLGIAGLGPLTGEGSGLLVMAIVGGAVIPEIQGIIADKIGLHHAFILPLFCYLFICYYGFRGSKPVTAPIA
jgi:FHS family L-fucose permease-like MFS transporter